MELEQVVKEVKDLKEQIVKSIEELVKKQAELEKKVAELEKKLAVERAIRKAYARLLLRRHLPAHRPEKAVDIKTKKEEDVRKKIEELKKRLAERKAKMAETPRPVTETKHPEEDERAELIKRILKGEANITDLFKKK